MEVGDSNEGIYIETDSEGLNVYIGNGNVQSHTVLIDENRDEYTIEHGTDRAIEIRVSKKAFKQYSNDSSMIIELYPQTTDDINIGGIRVWFSGVLVASYQHDFITEHLHSIGSNGGFRSINDSVVSNKNIKSWKNTYPNECKIFYKKTGRFITSNLLSNIGASGKTYKDFNLFSESAINYLSSNTSDEYKEVLTTNSPKYVSKDNQYSSHTMLVCFPNIDLS